MAGPLSQFQVTYSDSFISVDAANGKLYSSDSEKITNREVFEYENQAASEALGGSPAESTVDYQRMILLGRPYLCTIPQISSAPASRDTSAPLSAEEQQQVLARASDHGRELLKGMQGQCIYYAAGWWVYSFCYNDGIRQFHPLPPAGGIPRFPPVQDPSVHSYVLGRFDSDSDVPPSTSTSSDVQLAPQLRTLGETSFLDIQLTGGTTCDLTGRERRIEVQFHCNPSSPDRINMIKETASCVYLMIIHTPRLCSDVVFRPPQVEQPHTIACQEIVAEDEVASWTAVKSADLERTSRAPTMQTTAYSGVNPSIGGIELGGQKLVGGAPGRTIKVSQMLAAAQNAAQVVAQTVTEPRFVATFAKYDGSYTMVMSDMEMKRQGFKGSKEDVAKWIEDMHEFAGEGVPWRLDVFETAEGLEFRGIFGEDDEMIVEDDHSTGYDEGDEAQEAAAADETSESEGQPLQRT